MGVELSELEIASLRSVLKVRRQSQVSSGNCERFVILLFLSDDMMERREQSTKILHEIQKSMPGIGTRFVPDHTGREFNGLVYRFWWDRNDSLDLFDSIKQKLPIVCEQTDCKEVLYAFEEGKNS